MILMMLGFPVAAIAAVWWAAKWAKRNGRNPWRWCGVLGLVCTAYYGQWGYAVVQSTHRYGPSLEMLDRTRAELKRMGIDKSVGLGHHGPYSGCRVLLLEHFFFGCFSLRTGAEDGLSPETIRNAVQAACGTEDCPYQGWFRLLIVQMGPPITYSTDRGSVATKRGIANEYRFTIKGGTQ